jgi:predicted Zn-dependent protease
LKDRIGSLIQTHYPLEREMGVQIMEQEAKLGEIIFSQQKTGLKMVEGESLAMVRDIGGKLTRDSRYKFQFFVTDDKSVNAYAMPGGYVVVHTGLLQLADSAEEIAQELEKLFTIPGAKEKQVQNQISYLNDNTWEKIGLRYIKLFEK